MRLAIVGSRDFDDYKVFKSKLSEHIKTRDVESIISGGAKGADTLAAILARNCKIPITIYHPQWAAFGKAAGPIRNEQIVKACDMVIAFWDGKSRGTRSTIEIAHKMNKPCIVIQI